MINQKSIRDYFFELEKELIEFFKKGIRGKIIRSHFKNKSAKFLKQLQTSVWIDMRTMTSEQITAMNKLLTPAVIKNFSRMTNKLENEIVQVLKKDLPRIEMEKEIKHTITDKKYNARTLIATGSNAINQAKRNYDAEKSGLEYFKFVGDSPERKFCKKHYNKIYSKTEIEALDNEQGLPVFYFGGGYNCKHQWIPVIKDL